MKEKKNIFVVIGSASKNSANQKLVGNIAGLTSNKLDLTIFNDLKSLPHFDPDLSIVNTPKEIVEFRDTTFYDWKVLYCSIKKKALKSATQPGLIRVTKPGS